MVASWSFRNESSERTSILVGPRLDRYVLAPGQELIVEMAYYCEDEVGDEPFAITEGEDGLTIRPAFGEVIKVLVDDEPAQPTPRD